MTLRSMRTLPLTFAILACSPLGCAPDADIEVHITGSVNTPLGLVLDSARLHVTYESCGGFNGDCSPLTLFDQDIHETRTHFQVDTVAAAKDSVNDIERLSSRVVLTGPDFTSNPCIYLPSGQPLVEIDSDNDTIVYRYEGAYVDTICGN